MKAYLLAAGLVAGFVVPAFADETTVVKEHHDGDHGVEVGVPGVAGVHVGGSEGCESKTVHKENDEGDSKTVHKTNCD